MAKRKKKKEEIVVEIEAPVSPPKKQGHYKAKPSSEGYLGSVTIAGDEIEVWRLANLVAPDGDKVDGLYYPALDKIELEAHLSPKAERQTLIHELWHAIRHKYEIPLSYDQDEALAGPIGNGFAQALAQWLPKRNLRPWGKQ
jgi:hypothetical protein